MNATSNATLPTTPALAVASETATPQGLTLPCPFCGEAEASIALQLSDLSYTCGECSTDFTADDVRNLIHKWQAVLAWAETLPQFPA